MDVDELCSSLLTLWVTNLLPNRPDVFPTENISVSIPAIIGTHKQ
jgi:hypothetical protein